MIAQTDPSFSLNRRLLPPADVWLRLVWQHRARVLLIGTVFSAFGVLIAFLIKPEFRSEARIMPEMSNGSGDMFKRLASVAGFAGLDFAEADDIDAVRPDLYPNVLQSTPFVLSLIDHPIVTTDGQQTTIGRFLLPEESDWSWKRWLTKRADPARPLPQKPAGLVRLTTRQQELTEEISERVSARLDTRSGIITITANMPDANLAAAVAQLAMDYLTQYVTSYRTGKARQDLRFYFSRLTEARQRYQSAQLKLFRYNDQHNHYVVQAATMEKQRIEAELSIAQTVYMELSRQFEQVRLKVQERTPVFKVLEPARIPLRRASPRRTFIVLLSAGLGLAFGILSTLVRPADIVSSLRTILQQEPLRRPQPAADHPLTQHPL
ncbi:lipopolysaccharide biosynthesis protein [Spirosoma koreense]